MMSTQITVTLTGRQAQMLWSNCSGADLLRQQPDRFRQIDPTMPDPTDSVFADGSMYWCEHGSNALLLRAYEEACGFEVTLLSEEAVSYPTWPYPYVVLSSREWELLKATFR